MPAQEGEDRKARVDRELIELLNELRVALPGVQVLFAFLLILPFQARWADINEQERLVYFGTLLTTAAATALLIAPSSYHRLRFRSSTDEKEQMLFASNRLALAGILLVGVAITATIFLIAELLFGGRTAIVVAVVVAAWFLVFWYGLPLSRARRVAGHRGSSEERRSDG